MHRFYQKNKALFTIALCIISCHSYAQFYKSTKPESFADVGLGYSKIRNGYMLYTDFLGTPYINQDEKLCYSPVYTLRGKLTDGNFKYRLSLSFSNDKEDNIVHDTTYFHTTSYNYRLINPRFGFERILWSRWFEFKLACDFMYIYELYDVESKSEGYVIPNIPLKSESLSTHKTKAWGLNPFLIVGVPIKNIIFISLELGKYYAYGITNSHYKCHSLNLNNNHELDIDEEGKPSDFYRFDNNCLMMISIDYRFIKK